MKKQDKRFLRAEAAFEDALIRLCQGRRATELTASELVEAAGYSRSAFYAHYDNMEDFIQSIIRREATHFNALLDPKTCPISQITLAHLGKLSIQNDTELFTHIYEHRELYQLLLHDKLMDNTVEWMTDIVVEEMLSRIKWIKDGVFEYWDGLQWTVQNFYESLDLELVFWATASVYFALIQRWERTGYRYSPHYLAVQRINSHHQFVSVFSEKQGK